MISLLIRAAKGGLPVVALFLCCYIAAAQGGNDLVRPANTWILGQRASSHLLSGLSEITFTDTVRASRVDSFGRLEFTFANTGYFAPTFSLHSNVCHLFRNRAEPVTSHIKYDSDDFRVQACASLSSSSYGSAAILPLDTSLLLYTSEIYHESQNIDYFRILKSHAFSYLDAQRLANPAPLAPGEAVLDEFELQLNDTLVDYLVGYIPRKQGGWWGIQKSIVHDHFQRWQMTSDGVEVLAPVSSGPVSYHSGEGSVLLKLRPDGEAFALSSTEAGVMLYTIDRATADIELWDILPLGFDSAQNYLAGSDCAWSADGRYLYVTTLRHVFQFDTQAADIAASAVQIDIPDRAGFSGSYYRIERGADCRLYIGGPGSRDFLHAIDKPSRPGRACELYEFGLPMPTRYYVSLPKLPVYSLWARDRVDRGLHPMIDTAVCDSSIVAFDYLTYPTVSTSEVQKLAEAKVWPNPSRAGESLSVELPTELLSSSTAIVQLLAMDGLPATTQLVEHADGSTSFEVPPDVAVGTYILRIHDVTSQPVAQAQVVVH